MSTHPPPPPPRGPEFVPPEPPNTARRVLKVVFYVFCGLVLLFLVGFGLMAAACSGLFG